MAITYEQIATLNKSLPRMDIRGKNYSMVSSRIQAFRKLCPEGTISTEILQISEDMVVMKATITDTEGRILATGTACEEKGSSHINRTSYVENAETSAVGRALGMLGIGSEEYLCSVEELTNALKAQGDDAQTRTEIMKILNQFPERELARKICERYRVGSVSELSVTDARKCLKDLKKTVRDTDVA